MSQWNLDMGEPVSSRVVTVDRDRRLAPLTEVRRSFERRYSLAVLQRCDASIVARALGLQRPNEFSKARQLSTPFRGPAADA